jgi:lactoylglutathione lyase
MWFTCKKWVIPLKIPYTSGTAWVTAIKLHAIQGDCTGVHPYSRAPYAFAVGSVHEFAKKLDKLNIKYGNWKGDSKEPTLRADGVLQLYFQDPDGYWIEINSPAPKKVRLLRLYV